MGCDLGMDQDSMGQLLYVAKRCYQGEAVLMPLCHFSKPFVYRASVSLSMSVH